MFNGSRHLQLGLPYQQTSYSASNGTGVVNQVQLNYNSYGQLTNDYQAHSGSVNTSSTRQVQYAYSQPTGANYSRLSSMTYPNGRVLTYGYNPGVDTSISRVSYLHDYQDSISGKLENYAYLGLNTIVAASHTAASALPGLTYVKLSSEANGDAGDKYIGLDRFGRIVDQRWLRNQNGLFTNTDRFQYGYDRDGNVLYENNLLSSTWSQLYHSNGVSSNSSYDNLNRMTNYARGTLSASGTNGTTLDQVSSPLKTQSWNYDALGNWSSFVDSTNGTQTRSFDARNQITSLSGGGATATPTFDNNGNTTGDDQGHSYIFDAWNRLVQVKNGSTVLTTYGYDALGRRITESPAGTTTDLYLSSAGS